MLDFAPRRAAFRRLHEQGCFVMPNPWDRGSARFLATLGFPALASTSAGFAFSQGLPDAPCALSRDMVLAHLRDLVLETELPVSADFQAGYGETADDVGDSVRRCVECGVAGLSIEDASGDEDAPLYGLDQAVERVRAARAAIGAADVMLTARAECFLVGQPDPLAESIRRLRAYAEAGADVLYAPGVRRPEDVRAIVAAVAPRPVNLLLSGSGVSVADAAALGVRRISVGSALARAAWTAFMRSARALADGDVGGFEGIASTAELSRTFSE